jgi:predicted phage terminase large subunit-like protein
MLNQTQNDVTEQEALWNFAIEVATLQDSLYFFVRRAWHIVEPNEKFVEGRHLKLICDELEACFYGRQKKLIINVPPGFMKSLLTTVFFPAWVWTKAPHKKFMCISYSSKFAERDSRKCRDLVNSDWYQQRFNVRLATDQREKVNFENTEKGFRKAYGMTGITGDHGDFLIVDDPLNIEEAESQVARDNANYVMDDVLPSRVNDPQESVTILIMQRLNEDDPTGHMLKQGGWEHLCLPMEYEGERFVSSLGFKDFRTTTGELLWPERFPESVLVPLRTNKRKYAGQYQQRPSPLAGNIFLREWFENRYEGLKIGGFYISVDTASTLNPGSAKSSILVGALTGDYRLMPVFVWADKVEFPQLCNKIEEVARMFQDKLMAVIIEAKDNGNAAMQTLRQTAPEWLSKTIVPFNPPAKLSKEERAVLYSKHCENGSVILPVPSDQNADWLHSFEEELFTFPNCEYKDKIDCLVQLIIKLEPALSKGFHHRIGR